MARLQRVDYATAAELAEAKQTIETLSQRLADLEAKVVGLVGAAADREFKERREKSKRGAVGSRPLISR